MEVFIEHMVTKRPTMVTNILKGLIIVACGVLAFALFMISLGLGSWSFIGLFLAVGIVYGGYHLIRSFNVEFEYILTNYDLDVDRITAKSYRKRLTTINLRNLEIMAPANEKYQRELENPGIKQKIDASSGDPATKCFMKLMSDKNGLTLLLFNPNDEIIKGIKSLVPRKVQDL